MEWLPVLPQLTLNLQCPIPGNPGEGRACARVSTVSACLLPPFPSPHRQQPPSDELWLAFAKTFIVFSLTLTGAASRWLQPSWAP